MDAFAQHERARLKAVLDATSDSAIAGSRVTFAKHFETVCAKEPFCVMPDSLVESCRRLSEADICDMESSKVAPPPMYGELDADDHRANGIFAWIQRSSLDSSTPTITSICFRKCSTLPTSSANGTTTPLSDLFVYIKAYSTISRLKKTQALLPESSRKTLDKRYDSLGLEPQTTRPTGGI